MSADLSSYATQRFSDVAHRDGFGLELIERATGRVFADERRVVGAREHEEYSIPAVELEALNDAIGGEIEVIASLGPTVPVPALAVLGAARGKLNPVGLAEVVRRLVPRCGARVARNGNTCSSTFGASRHGSSASAITLARTLRGDYQFRRGGGC